MAFRHAIAGRLRLGPLVRLKARLEQAGQPSFSQCGEDVFLAHECHLPARGTYVDVGAGHPFRNSNTFGLYLRGWSGVVIEPNPAHVALHRIVRPRDRVVEMGVAEERASLTYYRFRNPDQNTFDPAFRDRSVAHGAVPAGERILPVAPLRDILDEAGLDGRIELMSVDCEGADLAVLRSADLSRHRPRWCVVEDLDAVTHPFKESATHAFMAEAGYRRVVQVGYSTIFRDAR